jgi:hypothetical protein
MKDLNILPLKVFTEQSNISKHAELSDKCQLLKCTQIIWIVLDSSG